jgi:predicted GNAT superfamily acetyltransferase
MPERMRDISIRDVMTADFDAVVALNASEVQHTSPMNLERLRLLDSISEYHKAATVNGKVAGFLLVMRDGCDYINDNFEWFSLRYNSFLYVDRIVVGSSYQGLKLGTLLYKDLFGYARAKRITSIACEYNVVPPNELSRMFHNKFSFYQVGTQWLCNDTKKVSLQVAKT